MHSWRVWVLARDGFGYCCVSWFLDSSSLLLCELPSKKIPLASAANLHYHISYSLA